MEEEFIMSDKTNEKGIRELTAYFNGITEYANNNTEDLVESSVEVLISLDPFGYKFSNLKLISKRKGADNEEVSKRIMEDLVILKNKFIERSAEIMG